MDFLTRELLVTIQEMGIYPNFNLVFSDFLSRVLLEKWDVIPKSES